ncbi:MAG: patatin-like phospholipase family protein [Acidobacteriota bacterium]|nr:patatin-like phospholipase family protein [Acidobacteriota bacterium]
MAKSFTDKLEGDPNRQRKLLALDGGGIRGMISVEILAEIEALLQKRLRRGDDFVLADYFDYIAGTSTGAIIATCLSLGMRVSDVRDFYIASGPAMFNRAGWLRQLHAKFEDEPLARKLREVIGEHATLGSGKLRTLLMIVLRNATTDSPWPLSNNPHAKYCARDRDDCNLDLPLWQLVRASTAAPTYFPPEVVDVGKQRFIFVDGGMTMYNNPAFQLFLMATVEPYNLRWPTGRDQMLLVSIGTGTAASANADLRPGQMNLLYNASSIPSALMFAALNEQDFLCRTFGDTLAGDELDSEIGDMIGAGGPVKEKLFTYVRYNAELTRKGLDALGLKSIVPETVQQLDSIQAIPKLQQVGRAVATQKVKPEHFERFPA